MLGVPPKTFSFFPFLSVAISIFSYFSFVIGEPAFCTRSPTCLSNCFCQSLLYWRVKHPLALWAPSKKPILTARVRMQSSDRGSPSPVPRTRSAGRALYTSQRSRSRASESGCSCTPPSGASSPGPVNPEAWPGITGRTLFPLFSFHLRSKGVRSAGRSGEMLRRFADHSCMKSRGGLVSRKSVHADHNCRAPSRWPSSQNTSTHFAKVGTTESSNRGLVVTLPIQLRRTISLLSVAEVVHVTAEPNLSRT
mmetsp:Transcript_43244/g.123262  ORF Transcript_43244/g.123262 Transcript_43244/m.123262 type:complete len:251 (-) Transcript_43244:364-1116(-)